MAWPSSDSAVFGLFDGGNDRAAASLLHQIFPRLMLLHFRKSLDEAAVLKCTMVACYKWVQLSKLAYPIEVSFVHLKRHLQLTAHSTKVSSTVIYLKQLRTGSHQRRWYLNVVNVGNDAEVILTHVREFKTGLRAHVLNFENSFLSTNVWNGEYTCLVGPNRCEDISRSCKTQNIACVDQQVNCTKHSCLFVFIHLRLSINRHLAIHK